MNLFITGTGTDIGKTFVACGLLQAARRAGQPVGALKPVMSGYDRDNIATCDAARLVDAMGEPVDEAAIARMSPFRFAAPLSPDIAAAREGRAIDFAALVACCQRPGPLLVEGVGGVMVPLTDRHTVLDWMATLGWPVVLVAGSYLGTISHTLTALAVLRARGIAVVRLVINESAEAPAVEETAATLQRFAPDAAMSILPRCAKPEHGVFVDLANLIGSDGGSRPLRKPRNHASHTHGPGTK